MRRLLLAVGFGLWILVGYVRPAHASEGHCATPVAEAEPGHEHARLAATPAPELHAAHEAECPQCPSRGPCAMLHGCGAVVATALAPAAPAPLATPGSRVATSQREAAPPSYVSSPPTPPPNRIPTRLA